MDNLMLSKGKEDLKKDLMNVVAKITKEVTNDVIKNTAVVSVQDLNAYINIIKKDSENVIKNLNVARNNYNQMLDKNNLSFKDMDNNINQISNKLTKLDNQINYSQENIITIINGAVNKGIKESAASILNKELLPNIKELNRYIDKTVVNFDQLNKNVNDVNKIQNETKKSLVEIENKLSQKIITWENNQKNLNASIEKLYNQHIKKSDELLYSINNNFSNSNDFLQKIYQNTNITINNLNIVCSEIIEKLNLIEQKNITLQNQIQNLLNRENELINIINSSNKINREFQINSIEYFNSLKKLLYIEFILLLIPILLISFIIFSAMML